MTQKIVMKVQMNSAKCRSKAMKIAVMADGVNKVEIQGDGKDTLVVTGEGIDSVKLACCLRKKFQHADIMTVEEEKEKKEEKKEEKKQEPTVVPCPLNCYCHRSYPPYAEVMVCPEPSVCSIM